MPDSTLSSSRRILVIDDNTAIHEDIRKILRPPTQLSPELSESMARLFDEDPIDRKQDEFEIDSAYQGQEGFEKVLAAAAAGRPYAMAFVDIRMPPGWDGVETIKRIWQVHPDMQAVICTAFSDYAWADMIEQIGRTSHMVVLKKPFDNIEVLQLAHALTEKWRLSRQIEIDLQELDERVARRTADLRQTNEKLNRESVERLHAEDAVRTLNAELELRVQQRTAELSAANWQLDKASRLKDEFLANMSHELRTPLNAILGLSETLIEQAPANFTPRQIKSVTTISTSGHHLLSLINDILDLSKIEAGKLELNLDSITLADFCESSLVLVRPQAMRKQIEVIFEPDAATGRITADSKRLRQILVNLLINAVKFTPVGGKIGLIATASVAEEVIRFIVWDTGIGIKPEHHAKLFQAFTQLDSGLSRNQEGTGLGLALVAKLVELHGGSVGLESEFGQGSRFTVTLPLIDHTTRAGRARSISPLVFNATDTKAFNRALIIEEDPAASEQIERHLEAMTITSVRHARGDQSVEVALSERPDFIILDLHLPNENGWRVLSRLKEHPGTREIPVIVVSVMDDPRKSLDLGAVAHFTKPVSRSQLAGVLQRTIPQGSSAPPLPVDAPVVLLAEDNEANIQTIGDYLDDKGYVMHYARNGLVAVRLVRQYRPDLILMDIQMPVMDGLAAIKEIQSDPDLQSIPIVALTALAMPEDRQRCLDAGAIDYLSKPVSLKSLAKLIHHLTAPPASGPIFPPSTT